MKLDGYIFTRIGIPDPAEKEYYLEKGAMIEAKYGVPSKAPASIYQRMEDYFGRTQNQS